MHHLKKAFYSLLLGCLYFLIHSSLLWVLCYLFYSSFFPELWLYPQSLGYFIIGYFGGYAGGMMLVLIFFILSIILNLRFSTKEKSFDRHVNYSLIYLLSNVFVLSFHFIEGSVDFILLSACIFIPITIISYFVERKIMRARNTEK